MSYCQYFIEGFHCYTCLHLQQLKTVRLSNNRTNNQFENAGLTLQLRTCTPYCSSLHVAAQNYCAESFYGKLNSFNDVDHRMTIKEFAFLHALRCSNALTFPEFPFEILALDSTIIKKYANRRKRANTFRFLEEEKGKR